MKDWGQSETTTKASLGRLCSFAPGYYNITRLVYLLLAAGAFVEEPLSLPAPDSAGCQRQICLLLWIITASLVAWASVIFIRWLLCLLLGCRRALHCRGGFAPHIGTPLSQTISFPRRLLYTTVTCSQIDLDLPPSFRH